MTRRPKRPLPGSRGQPVLAVPSMSRRGTRTMKAARLHAYDEHMQVDLTLEMVPEPTITAADEVIVRVGAAGLCRTDLHIIEGVWRRAMDPQGTLLPYILGHENAGWVE